MAGEIVEHVQLVCGEAFAIVDGLLWKLERICEEYPEDEEE